MPKLDNIISRIDAPAPELIALMLSTMESTRGAIKFLENASIYGSLSKTMTQYGVVKLKDIQSFEKEHADNEVSFSDHTGDFRIYVLKRVGGHFDFIVRYRGVTIPEFGQYCVIQLYQTRPDNGLFLKWFSPLSFRSPMAVVNEAKTHDGLGHYISILESMSIPSELCKSQEIKIGCSYPDRPYPEGFVYDPASLINMAIKDVFADGVSSAFDGESMFIVFDDELSVRVTIDWKLDEFGSIRNSVGRIYVMDHITTIGFGPHNRKRELEKYVSLLTESVNLNLTAFRLAVEVALIGEVEEKETVAKPKDTRSLFEKIFDLFT